jgi:hypothetical protein
MEKVDGNPSLHGAYPTVDIHMTEQRGETIRRQITFELALPAARGSGERDTSFARVTTAGNAGVLSP